METGGLGALPMIGLALAIGILSFGFIFRVCNVEVDDSDRKTKRKRGIQRSTSEKRSESENDSVVGNTSSTSVIVEKFEVFLSFRPIDTRKGFTDFLYKDLVDAGICTFREDDELPDREEIGPELMKAIEESKICIPILSQNYASNIWCLLELAQIVECKRSTGEKILPIFYDVEPCDVQNQTGSYKEAFRQYEKRFDKETVQRWKEALKEVGELKGWELQKETNGHQGELVKIIVEEVLLELKKNCMVVTDKLVGTDHHFEEMKRLLNVDSNDVRIVGIHGMGGLGKTTIAKVVYNELSECFDCCCFLENVREMSQQYSGLVNLQKQLISKIRKGKFPDIANVDEGINMIKGIACNKKVLIVLDDVDEESLFANLVGKHDWFGSGSRIIVTTRNKKVLNVIEVYEAYEPQPMKLDDALQLFSKCAFGRNFPLEDFDYLSKKLVSTTGGLPLALEIIGSFLYGKGKGDWEDTLVNLKVKPHDLVQKQLRISYDALNYEEKQIFLDIACFFIGENKTLPFYMWNDCKYYPTRGIDILVLRSLVKIGDDNEFRMHDQLRDLGREIVRQESTVDPGKRSRLWIYNEEALDEWDGHTGTKNVEALSLQTYGIGWKIGEHSFTNDEFQKLPNLRFLRVDCTDLNGDFKYLLSKLRWLQWCMCTDNSKPINFHLKNLVILDLSYSYITENWEGWNQIKMAKRLKVLDLSFCEGLTTTPDFSTFVSLERLILKHCRNLVEIEPSIGNLIELRVLDISSSGIRKLPDAVGDLEKLEEIYVSYFQDFQGNIPSIILRLPELPPSLRSLRLAHYFMETLPSLSNLMNLSDLKLFHCHGLKEIQGLERLESLRYLNASKCQSLKRLPDLSKFVMLETLCLYGCYNLVEVRGLTGLKSLEKLNLRWCTSLDGLHDLSNMEMLKILDLCGCKKLAKVGGLGGLKSLEMLNVSACNLSEELLDLSNLKKLKKLAIRGWKNLTEVQGLEELESLEILDISGCRFEKSLDLSNLQKLEELKANRCENLLEIRGLEELKSLEILDISGCKLLEKSLYLSNLQNLKFLDVHGCENLPEIWGLEKLESLKFLNISGCKAIEKLPAIEELPNLSDTHIVEDPELLDFLLEGSDYDSDPDFYYDPDADDY